VTLITRIWSISVEFYTSGITLGESFPKFGFEIAEKWANHLDNTWSSSENDMSRESVTASQECKAY